MGKLVCMRHRTYSGQDTPDLKCKACCILYVDLQVKQAQNKMMIKSSPPNKPTKSLTSQSHS